MFLYLLDLFKPTEPPSLNRLTLGLNLPEVANRDAHLEEESVDIGDVELVIPDKEMEQTPAKERKIPAPTTKPPVLKAPPKVHIFTFGFHALHM